jgi:hypothetical protein
MQINHRSASTFKEGMIKRTVWGTTIPTGTGNFTQLVAGHNMHEAKKFSFTELLPTLRVNTPRQLDLNKI